MDWMTFIVELVKALAWPAVAVTVILTFKEKLTKLFEDMTELKGLGIEAKFARGAKEALAEVEVIEIVEPLDDQPPEVPLVTSNPEGEVSPQQMVNMLYVMLAPKGAVLQARANLESAVSRLFTEKGLAPETGGKGVKSALRSLAGHGYVSPSLVKTTMELIDLGNKAAHDQFEPSVSSAKDYVTAANSVVRLLGAERKSS
ncbi:hypothetical protein [Hydrogenophaga sp.]|uniref:hypothetical protein n=1 Tax=Hydrogenophaga sp. TaxID=1904254 RepID=UPI00271DD86F|nr:hypothetical protein [Hydrogenophaga sp.]MDO9131703.1 hypothetical protein [Hydrogenophaga sp.]